MLYPKNLKCFFNDESSIKPEDLPAGVYKNRIACLSRTFPMSNNLLGLRRDRNKVIVLNTKVVLACLLAAAEKTEDGARLVTSSRHIAQHFNTHPSKIFILLNRLQRITVQGLPLITLSKYDPEKVIKEVQAKDTYKHTKKFTVDDYKNSILELHTKERAIEIKFPAYKYIKREKGKYNFSFDINLDMYATELDISARVLLFLLQSRAWQKYTTNKKVREYTGLFHFAQPRYILRLFDKLVECGFIEYTLEGRDKYTQENQIVQVKLTAKGESKRIRTKA